MNKNSYKRAIGKFEPDEQFEYRLAEKLKSKPETINVRSIASIAACFVLVIGAILITSLYRSDERPPSGTPNHTVAEGAVYIPKIELPKKSNAAADMIGLIVYKGKIYTQTHTKINPEDAKPLLGQKIGRTKGNIDEWSSQDDYATELASSIGSMDVYTVKGYDSKFRIMTYEEQNGEIWTEFYECLNGIEVKSGSDIFSKLNMIGNVQSAWWEKYESWNNSKQEYTNIDVDETVHAFLQALYEAKPLVKELSQSERFFDNGDQTQKFLSIKLKDNSVVTMRLFKDGHIMYGHSHLFFKVDSAAFDELWYSLK